MKRLEAWLVHPPFLSCEVPSIALTQLKAVVDSRLGSRARTRIAYVSHDFANYFGLDVYDELGRTDHHLRAGLSEWFFRQAAFPDAADNRDQYFRRFYPLAQHQRIRQVIAERRAGLTQFLDLVIARHQLHRADVVGFTSMFQENLVAVAFARRLKQLASDIIVVLGGSSCESPAGEELVRNVDCIDYVFSGPALESFPDFIEACASRDAAARDRIDGVFSRRNCATPARRLPLLAAPARVASHGRPAAIDSRIELDYDSFFADLDRNFPGWDVRAVVPFETSRGCWWGEKSHCTFCGLNDATMSYRAMTPERAIETIGRLVSRYQDRAAVFMCVDSILEPSYIKEVLPRLEAPRDAVMFCQIKANLREADVQALARAGIRQITPGIESLATSTLKLMNKGLTAFRNVELMKWCLQYGVYPGWNLLVGSPGEDEEVYERYVRVLPLLVHLPPPLGLFTIAFQRYSPYFADPKRYGLELRPADYYPFVYPFAGASIERIAYEFVDDGMTMYRRALARWFEPMREQVDRWLRTWTDAARPPELYLEVRGGQRTIVDSRFGPERVDAISDAEYRVLQALDTHRRVDRVAADLGAEGLDAAREIARLDERGLLFREGELALSLVLPRRADPLRHDFRTFLKGRWRPRRDEEMARVDVIC